MEAKVTQPLLPLRDIVVFPSMVIPLFVGRDKSITALNEVMKGDKKIVLVTQKNSEVDDPKKNDVFSYGCESNILQLLKLPDGTVKVLVEGIKRVKLVDFKDDEKFISCTFEYQKDILTKDEGGRHTPFFGNYRPQFYFRTTDVTGTVQLPSGTEMVMPGDNLKFEVELIAPIAMEEKLRFAIREGGRTVGAGVVSKIIE